MRKNIFIVGLVLMSTLGLINCQSQAEQAPVKESVKVMNSYSGSWSGSLDVGGQSLEVVFHINEDETKALFDSPDQSVFGIKASDLTISDAEIVIAIKMFSVKFKGSLTENGTINGEWTQNGVSLPLELARTTNTGPKARPQDPKGPFPYTETEIRFPNEQANIMLAGTLTQPESSTGDKWPFVILVSGSGPQNRNEELMNHSPFWVIADYLSRNGIAVFRYDDRGVAESEGDFSKATTSDLASDAESAADFLKKQYGSKISKLGIIGHSEGGMMAPEIAAANSNIDFIIMLAGSVFSGEDVLYQQSEVIMRKSGFTEEAIKEELAKAKLLYNILKKPVSNEEAKDLMLEALRKHGGSDSDLDQATLELVLNPWFRQFLGYQSKDALEKINIPVFALNGSLDVQVLADINLELIEQTLKKSGNNNYRVKKYEGLNHLFQHAKSGMMDEYGKIEETIAPEVLADIKDWIKSL